MYRNIQAVCNPKINIPKKIEKENPISSGALNTTYLRFVQKIFFHS